MHKTLSLAVALLLCIPSFGQSQMEMNLEAESEYKQADNRLNAVYQKILNDYESDQEFIKNLKASERLWIKFRDAEMLMKYPKNGEVRNGSVFPLCYYIYSEKLTEQRIETLNQWIDGHPEGEVCGGSVRLQ